MIIKKAILKEEIDKVISFLEQFDLKYDDDIVETFFIEENNQIIATISKTDYIIKGLAVQEVYQGLNLASKLVTEVINSLAREYKYYYQVFTKSIYTTIFLNMGFKKIASTNNVVILEGGISGINEEILKIKKQVEFKFDTLISAANIGSIVVNCNPITNGHLRLIEYASSKHDYLIVFVVEEDKSFFNYKERFSLIYLALGHLTNTIVLPSSKYIVSNLTFPSYFLKTMDEKEEEHAYLDAYIFNDYFIPLLNITKRYVGTETDAFMIRYNNILKNVLGEKLEVIPRFRQDGQVISASLVRKYLSLGKVEEALALVPNAIKALLKAIINEKTK